jgi:D-glycero-D-manno-heptose 1,7-bisphosphate phosphatase
VITSALLPAVFFDRDDTLIHCNELPPAPPPAKPGDLVHPQLVRLLPGVLDACAALRDAGFRLVVFSNQGVVARGAATLEMVECVHDRMRALLTRAGEHRSLIEATYYCPYYPEGLVARFTGENKWRKPKPGMIRAAAAELELDLSRSWVVGDAVRDVEAGQASGLAASRCLLVRAGTPIPDVATAARVILTASQQ